MTDREDSVRWLGNTNSDSGTAASVGADNGRANLREMSNVLRRHRNHVTADRTGPRSVPALVLLFVGTIFGATPGLAQDPTIPKEELSSNRTAGPGSHSEAFAPWSTLIPYPGFRDGETALESEAIYYADLHTNTRGGISTRNATRYQGLLDIGVTIHLDRTHCPIPGRVHLLGQTTHGEGLTENFVGDTLVLSDIDSFRNITHLGEFWWEFQPLEEIVTLRFGKQDVNTEFAYMETAVHFVQSSFELTPNSALPTYPQQSIGAVGLVQLHPSLQWKVGIWDALADSGSWGFSGNNTFFLTSELEYKYALQDDWLPGTIDVAVGYLSDGEFAGQTLDAVHGYALQWEQVLFREPGSDADQLQGLSLFAAYYPRLFGPNRLQESIGDNAVWGLVSTGLLPRRDLDSIGIGISWAQLFQGGTGQETALEFYYRAQLTPRFSLQPDLQYIATPSGIHPDALVVGVRLQLEL